MHSINPYDYISVEGKFQKEAERSVHLISITETDTTIKQKYDNMSQRRYIYQG